MGFLTLGNEIMVHFFVFVLLQPLKSDFRFNMSADAYSKRGARKYQLAPDSKSFTNIPYVSLTGNTGAVFTPAAAFYKVAFNTVTEATGDIAYDSSAKDFVAQKSANYILQFQLTMLAGTSSAVQVRPFSSGKVASVLPTLEFANVATGSVIEGSFVIPLNYGEHVELQMNPLTQADFNVAAAGSFLQFYAMQ